MRQKAKSNGVQGVQKQWTKGSAAPQGQKFEIRFPTATVWLGNLPTGVEFDQLKQHMARAGNCKHVHIGHNGTGFALFKTPQEAKTAIAKLNGSKLRGAQIVVDSYATKPEKTRVGSFKIWGQQRKWSGSKAGKKFEIRHPNGTVWLGNIAPGTPYQEVETFLEQAGGDIKKVQLTRGGTGFAVFSTPQQAKDAISMLNGAALKDSVIALDSYHRKQGDNRRKVWEGAKGGGQPKQKINAPDNTLWVGNLPRGTEFKEVMELVNQVGRCKRVQMLRAGTAFAIMSSSEEVAAAVDSLQGMCIGSQEVKFDFWVKKGVLNRGLESDAIPEGFEFEFGQD